MQQAPDLKVGVVLISRKIEKSPVDTRTSVAKPLGGEWMFALLNYLLGSLTSSLKEIKACTDN